MDTRKVGLGTLLLVVSAGILTATGRVDASLPTFVVAVSPLVLGAGALLVGSDRHHPSA